MILEEPYFMSDDSWYIWNSIDFRYELTQKAPLEAVISYYEFYKILDNRYYLDD